MAGEVILPAQLKTYLCEGIWRGWFVFSDKTESEEFTSQLEGVLCLYLCWLEDLVITPEVEVMLAELERSHLPPMPPLLAEIGEWFEEVPIEDEEDVWRLAKIARCN
ncbi:MAG: hypothetical protein WDZ85_01850 [Candidatus Paceibacterota bacterium]